ncbi:MAG: hypothetical protein LBF42_01825 [Puniceicoccales bacterium]|jgi:peptidoglycan hydrolase CwlO-like protein|nr:hypothetical protein [Puniceicoccales bacterium]
MSTSATQGQFGGIGQPAFGSPASGTFQNVTAGAGEGLATTAGTSILEFTKALCARVASVAGAAIEIGRSLAIAYPAAAIAIFVAAGIAVYCGYKYVQHVRGVMADKARQAEHLKQKDEIQALISEIQDCINDINGQIEKLEAEAANFVEERNAKEKELGRLNNEERAPHVEQQQVPDTSQNRSIARVGKGLAIAVGVGVLGFTKGLYARVAPIVGAAIEVGRSLAIAYPTVAIFGVASMALYYGNKYVQRAREVVAEKARQAEFQQQRNLIQGRIDDVQGRIDDIDGQIREWKDKAAALEEKRRAAEGVLNRLNSEEKARLESLMGGQQQASARPQRRALARRRQASGK